MVTGPLTSWHIEGWAEGYAEGWAEGRAEGRAESKQELVLRQITKRFGPLASDLEARIDALPLEQLDNLGEALLDFTILGDVTTWLDAHPTALTTTL